MANLICPKCGKTYNSEDLRAFRCKECRAWLDLDEQEVAKSLTSEPDVIDPLLELDPATREVVLATNRTTYAVRSLALFLFTTLCTSLIGYGLIGAGAGAAVNCNSYSECGADAFVIWGWIVIIIGFIFGLGVGVSELSKSKP